MSIKRGGEVCINMMNKLLILLVTGLMCLVFVGAASAVTNSEPAYPNAVETDNSAIDGHKIVYEYKSSDTDHDIYIRDLTTTTSTPVTTSLRDDRNPDISGNIVVWQSKATGGRWQIYWKDTSTNNPEAKVRASLNEQINPCVSGNYVVWQEYVSASDADTNNFVSDYDIRGYDLATTNYYGSIATSNQFEANPDISGNTVVYNKYENLGTISSPNWKMQVYKTTFGTNNQGTKIHPYNADQTNPVISGNKVLWTQYNKNTKSDDVWYENLATKTGFWVTQTINNEVSLAIAGNIAVWQKPTTTDFDILMQDVSSSSNPKKSVAKGISDQWNPAVGVDQYGIFASFTDHKDGTDRVYWRNMDVTTPKVTAGSPARNTVNVPVNRVITTTFNEAIKLGAGKIKLITSSGTMININTEGVGKVLYVSPLEPLQKATKYTLILAAGSVTDYAGNPIAAYSRSFTTDNTPPTPIAGSPARDAVNVARNAPITTTFNENIYATMNMWITLKTTTGTPVAITPVIIDGNVLQIFHALLAPSTKYLLELHTGCLSDQAGNLLKYYYRYFTTGNFLIV